MGANSRSIDKTVLNSIRLNLFRCTNELREEERRYRQETMSFCIRYLKINENEEEMERLKYLLIDVFISVFVYLISFIFI